MYHIMRDEFTDEIIEEVLDDVIDLRSSAITTIFTPGSCSSNKSMTALNDVIECPICLENISQAAPLLILDCCSKTVHLECIIDWYSKHPKNKNCFMCNQPNTFCRDLVYTEDDEQHTNSARIIDIQNTDIQNTDIQNTDIQNIRNMDMDVMRYRCVIMFSIIGIFFVVMSLIFTFIILF